MPLMQDFRHGLRRSSKSPAFTLTAVLTLALAMGATTVVYSVVQAVLLNSLSFPQPEQLYVLAESQKGQTFSVAWPNFDDWRRQSRSFEGMAAYQLSHFEYFDGNHTILPRAAVVTAEFFPLLRAQPIKGRAFSDAE